MQCSEVMSRSFRSVRPGTPIIEAAQLMRDGDIGFVPVCDENMRPVGTLTDRDIVLRVVAEDVSSHTPVSQVLTSTVHVCSASDTVQSAQEVMRQRQIQRIVCEQDGRAVGVLSLTDTAQSHEAVATTYAAIKESGTGQSPGSRP